MYRPPARNSGVLRQVEVHRRGRNEVCNVGKSEAHSIPQLVAELTITNHALDIKVDIAALHGIREKTKAKGIGTALGNTLRDVRRLALFRLDNLRGMGIEGGNVKQRR